MENQNNKDNQRGKLSLPPLLPGSEYKTDDSDHHRSANLLGLAIAVIVYAQENQLPESQRQALFDLWEDNRGKADQYQKKLLKFNYHHDPSSYGFKAPDINSENKYLLLISGWLKKSLFTAPDWDYLYSLIVSSQITPSKGHHSGWWVKLKDICKQTSTSTGSFDAIAAIMRISEEYRTKEKPDENQHKTPLREFSEENVFRNTGDFWEVRFRGKKLPLIKNSKGMAYIAQLLGNPDENIPAFKLVQVVRKLTGEKPGLSEEEALDEHVTFSKEDSSISSKKNGIWHREARQVIDSKYVVTCLKKIDELKKAKERAEKDKNTTEAKVLQHEIDEIWKHLESSKGLSQQPRSFLDEMEKARIAVNKAITRSFNRIEKENQELWRHLINSIHTGQTCSYIPDQKIDWQQ